MVLAIINTDWLKEGIGGQPDFWAIAVQEFRVQSSPDPTPNDACTPRRYVLFLTLGEGSDRGLFKVREFSFSYPGKSLGFLYGSPCFCTSYFAGIESRRVRERERAGGQDLAAQKCLDPAPIPPPSLPRNTPVPPGWSHHPPLPLTYLALADEKVDGRWSMNTFGCQLLCWQSCTCWWLQSVWQCHATHARSKHFHPRS